MLRNLLRTLVNVTGHFPLVSGDIKSANERTKTVTNTKSNKYKQEEARKENNYGFL
jgi:hypothetical protein